MEEESDNASEVDDDASVASDLPTGDEGEGEGEGEATRATPLGATPETWKSVPFGKATKSLTIQSSSPKMTN